ncbi:MAG TPA: family 16 glycoside hydrolase [Chloroflexota bacterium]|nr:family 16 glycoside hydrolase [Chloroflexota bacterium]
MGKALGTIASGMALLVLLLPSKGPAVSASVVDQVDGNVVVQITRPQAGEKVQGTVEITGYAADTRSSDGSGLNENDIAVYFDDSSNPQNLIGYAASERPSPDAASQLGPQFARVGFQRVWDTCQVSPGAHELIVWVSSLTVPGARGVDRVEVEVQPCAAATTPTVAAQAPQRAPEVLYRDDFSDPSSGWLPQSPDPSQWTVGYENGEYKTIQLAGARETATVPLWNHVFRDFQAEVDARLLTAGSSYIILGFRGQSLRGLYQLAVAPTSGIFALGRADPSSGTWTMLIPARPAAGLHAGSDWNRIGVRAVGGDLTVLINGQQVAQAHDDTYREGIIFLGAGDDTSGRAEARFRNLVVTSAE